jgi:urea transport system permease protein
VALREVVRRIPTVALAAVSLLVGPGGVLAAGSGPAALEATAEALAAPATQKEAIAALAASDDPAAERLLRALKDGALYVDKGRVVVFGDDGKLTDAAGRAVLDERGRPVELASGQEAIAVDESQFGAIQRALERFEVFSGDPARRISAAFKLGNSGDAAAVAILAKALERETQADVRAVIEEALAKLQLSSTDPAERRRAVERLGRVGTEAAVPHLAALLERERDPAVKAAAKSALDAIDAFIVRRNVVGYVFNGISLSAVLLIMSLGLAVTFGLMGIINMAHGEMLMIGSYTAYVIQNVFAARWPGGQDYYFFVALPLAFVVAGVVGLALELGVIRFLYGRPLETLIVTWGIGMILQQSARLYFGDQTSVNPPSWFRGGVEVLPGLIFPWSRIFIVGLALAALAALWLVLYRSYAGLKVRAVMQNRAMASCVGISTRRIDAVTFALGTALAGVAGCALALIGTVDPEVGKTYIVDSFMVVVLGGVGKLLGTVVASLCIGLASKLLEPAIAGTAAAVYAKVAVLVIVIAFLQWRPTGLFAQRGRAAAEAAS